MFTLTCPRCQKNSYSSDEESFHACPYCGFKFSKKYGSDRRREERVKQETFFDFSCQEQLCKANTVDFSEKGLSIKILDDPPIKEGDTVELTIGDNKVKAKVIWTNKQFDKSTVGLQRLN